MAQDRPREFGEEALDEIEPRTMLGREGKLEASRRSRVEPGSCFSRYVRGMIIEDQLDRGAGRISGVETLEEFDELPAAVAVSDERMDLPGKQVDSGQQAQHRWLSAQPWPALVTRYLLDHRRGREIDRAGLADKEKPRGSCPGVLLVLGEPATTTVTKSPPSMVSGISDVSPWHTRRCSALRPSVTLGGRSTPRKLVVCT